MTSETPLNLQGKRARSSNETKLDVEKNASDASNEEITYPTGMPVAHRASMVWQLRLAAQASKSHFFISSKFESLDYVKILNRLEVEKQKSQTFHSLMVEHFLRIMYFILAGILTAFVGVFVEYGVMALGAHKYKFLGSYIEEHFRGSLGARVQMTVLWFLGSIIPIMVGSCLVVFFAPYAAGGGVAQCVAYLNGVRVPRVLSIKGLVVKAFSNICCVISGLAGGKEGPMMHMGAISGGSLPSALPWQVFKSDQERRDLAAAGFGAGIAVAFGAPIGGLLLSMEEGVSFWDIGLMWKIYICVLFAYFVGILLMSFIEGIPGNLDNPELLTFGKLSPDVTEYELFEVWLFAVEGAIGGLVGASLIYIHTYTTIFRRRFVQTKTRKLTESFLVACLVATLSLSAVLLVRNCSSDDRLGSSSFENVTRHTSQLYCEEGQYSDMSLIFFQTQEGVIHSLFGSDPIQIPSLLVYCAIYYILVCFTMGLSISAGVFVPQIVLGAAWGRIVGLTIHYLLPDAQWAKPAKYAYLGAAAQLSGTVGKTFSILVIMVEASSEISFSFPLMVVVCVSKWVENLFVIPIYETQVHLMGMPVLPSSPPPLSVDILTSDVMSQPPLVTLPPTPTVQVILDVLQATKHNGFPVVSKGGKVGEGLLGLILRQQLLVLLKYKAYKYPTPESTGHLCQCLDLYLKEARKQLHLEKIQVEPKYLSAVLDLGPYYNPYPYTVQEALPLTQTYTLFRSLGLRHIIVTSSSGEAVAMVTRKDLAKFHTWETLCRMGVKEMPIKP